MHTDYLYINNFSKLHNNKNIFFCKTDYILHDFKTISKLDNNVILITGNSDYAITDELVDVAPKNIKAWYAQNAISNSDIIFPLPIGLENKFISERTGHGVAYTERAIEKEIQLNLNNKINPNKFIYANFNTSTNPQYRLPIKQHCINYNYIDWSEPILKITKFLEILQEYKMVLCPAGNGIDTHRLWEVLYSNRIPITFRIGEYKIYKLYEKLPIILLNSLDELSNLDFLEKEYYRCKTKKFNKLLLNNSYWIDNILKKSYEL